MCTYTHTVHTHTQAAWKDRSEGAHTTCSGEGSDASHIPSKLLLSKPLSSPVDLGEPLFSMPPPSPPPIFRRKQSFLQGKTIEKTLSQSKNLFEKTLEGPASQTIRTVMCLSEELYAP